MSDKGTVFNTPDKDVSADTENVEDTFLEKLVGEGKKYSTVEELAKAKEHADKHISTLESENNEMRLRLEKAANVEDVLAALKEEREKEVQKETPAAPGLKEDDVVLLLEKREKEKVAVSNILEADRKFRERFGDTSEVVLAQKVNELGVTTDYLKNIAADSPKLFLDLFNTVPNNKNSASPTTPKSSMLPSNLPKDELTVHSLLEKSRQEGKTGLTNEQRQALFKKAEEEGLAAIV
ncbi:MAG: hypothetical protein ACE5H1_00575 [Thermodesulfobacteriota bacterium]